MLAHALPTSRKIFLPFLSHSSAWRPFTEVREDFPHKSINITPELRTPSSPRTLLFIADTWEAGWYPPQRPQVTLLRFCSILILVGSWCLWQQARGHGPGSSQLTQFITWSLSGNSFYLLVCVRKEFFIKESYKMTMMLAFSLLISMPLDCWVSDFFTSRESKPIAFFTQGLLWKNNENGNQWLQN